MLTRSDRERKEGGDGPGSLELGDWVVSSFCALQVLGIRYSRNSVFIANAAERVLRVLQ